MRKQLFNTLRTRRKTSFLFQEDGNAIVFVALALVAVLSIAGLVIDGGTLYMTKSHLQKTANAAVLSGAQELTSTETEVRTIVDKILSEHKEETSLKELEITPESRVEIVLEKEVTLAFSTLLGRQTATVTVEAAAEIGVMGRVYGAAPIGIDDSIPLEHYVEYALKVDQTEVDTGNFGVLALGASGASTYEDNMRYGYSAELKIGDIIETQTGNISGKTRLAVNERIQGCAYSAYDAIPRNCSRVLLIPVYKPNSYESNQLKDVKITGFAYFYLTEPMSNNDTYIRGLFIKRTGTGFIEPTSSNRGAYSIRLTK